MVTPAPKVSVVMAVYNERPYLETAVRSILNQTFEDFEFIIVDDGSTDGSGEVLDRFEQNDDRIRLVHQENRGVIASLNRGLDMARGKYVARMDGDDISRPERFERQVAFLEDNPEIGVLGTQVDKIDADGNVREGWNRSLPTDPDILAWRLLFSNCLHNPTVMMRHALLERLEGYAEWARHMEDRELWARAVLETRLENLPDALLKFRRHQGSVTVKRREEQIRRCTKAVATLHHAILGPSADEQIAGFLAWMDKRGVEKATEETGVKDFSSVHEHIRSLYRVYTRRLSAGEANIQVQRGTLRKLDTVANQAIKTEGLSRGAVLKLRSWSILSATDVFPLIWKVLRSRIRQW
jgi:glycosyltransferase involved in cell wall biosynthesis